MLVYQALQIRFSIMRHVFSKHLSMRFVCSAFMSMCLSPDLMCKSSYTNMQPVIHRSRFVHHVQVLSPDFSRYLSHSIKISWHAQDQEHQHGTCAAGLPGICDKNLVSHTMGDHKSPSAWLRGLSQPEKPTRGTSARAQCPTRGRNPLTAARTARKTHRFLNGGRVP